MAVRLGTLPGRTAIFLCEPHAPTPNAAAADPATVTTRHSVEILTVPFPGQAATMAWCTRPTTTSYRSRSAQVTRTTM